MTQVISDHLARIWANFDLWFAFGLIGQTAFGLRFLYQWIVSERRKESVIPVGFWYLSITGSLILFIYGIGRAEPILILGHTLNSFIYTRNLMFIYRKRAEEATT